MPCGCGGSTQPRPSRQIVRQKAASTVPGGPGEDGYTWDGPQKAKTPAPAKTK
jgi:hypothetical protein